MNDPDPSQRVGELIAAGRDREAAHVGALAASPHAPSRQTPTEYGEPMDPLTQFAQLAPALGKVVAGITPDDLDRSTPCAEFTVRGVLEHMIGGATAFAAAYRGVAPETPDLSDALGGFGPALDGLAAAVSAPGALDRTVAAPFGEVPGDVFARFIVLDGLVHGWDLATATGQDYEPPDELVRVVESFAHETLDPLRDGTTFGAAVEPAKGASPIERLANYTGRRA